MRLWLALAVAVCLPALAAEDARCPWMNAATAGGFLGGAVRVTVTPTSCEYVHREGASEATLRIEVAPVSAPHAHCGPGAESLKAIGNAAQACAFEGKTGWTSEQVVGRVRDRAFLVRLATHDPGASRKTLRQNARDAAELLAGFLF